MYPRPRVLITYCRKRNFFISLSTSVPDIMEDESKTKSTNVDTTLPGECTVFASETRSRQMYPRPKVLTTYCRKRRRNSVALASTIPAIVEDAVIQESKTKSADVDITLPAESSEFVEINDFVIVTRSQQVHPRLRVLITYFRKRRRNSSILGNSLPSFVENVGTCAFGSSTNEFFDEERQSLAESSSSPSSLCAFIDEKTEITNVGAFPPLRRALNGRSNKKLLVLDLNGLLADIVPLQHVPYGFKVDTIVPGKAVFKRPFNDDFLQFCLEKFNVGVWSSRIRKNVELVLDFLLGNAKEKLLFCWDQSHCTDTGFPVVGKRRSKPIILKKLKKLWEKFEPDLPWERGEYDESNTLLLDDSPHKALCNPPNTAAFPNTYLYTDEKDDSLGPEGDLRVYLEGLSMAENVQKYVESNPFGQRPITEKNVSWRYYCKVIEAATCIPEHSANRFSTYQY
ncbi:uncharacterized protein LOC129895710 [Solanum dulcamara]|uniref:uncharacterized protein LOC129895710 n=1 Tax=Solanum dulcamara TaxID=45834 RepID=UPI00248632DC|nr:uncharacterized protein LOC129895710 [Solanum dulcamara]XP_055827436.1 uncharacterized protein LOC129895710 [Solanum dulcamara]